MPALPCLFPQHGPGKKHERAIDLRGLLWSDGSSFVNRHGRYEDRCFEFSNSSDDLLEMLCCVSDVLGIRYRFYAPGRNASRARAGQVRFNRREAVAALVEHVGIKQ